MFSGAKSFNQPLDKWNMRNVEYMNFMFFDAESFNQSLDNWKIRQQTLDQQTTDVFKQSPLENNPPKWYKK